MPQWNKPLADDTEPPWKTIAGALGVFALGVGCAIAAYWTAMLIGAAVHDFRASPQSFSARRGSPYFVVGSWACLGAAAGIVAAYCAWTGVRWFWVWVGALLRGERVDDNDPDTTPAKAEE